MMFDLRHALFNHLQRLSLRFYDQERAGSIISRVMNDIGVAQQMVSGGVINVIMDTAMITAVLYITFRLNVTLTLVALTVMPFYVLTYRNLNPKIRSASRRIQEKLAQISGDLFETVSAIAVVQSFTREKSEEKSFVSQIHKHYDRVMRQVVLRNSLSSISQCLSRLGTALILLYGGRLVLQRQLTMGELVAFYTYVAQLYAPVVRFSEVNDVVQTAIAAIDRIFELFDEVPDVQDVRKPVRRHRIRGEVEFRNVTFEYTPGIPVLHDVDFRVEPGRMVALVGHSGSGKSTIANLLLRFYDVAQGQILIDGIDVRNYAIKSLRQQIGLVLQETILFSGSLRENIEYGRLNATDEDIAAAAKAANAHDFVLELEDGYETEVGERGVKLSGGQKQRVAITRVMLKNPRILVLDEATSALDSESENLVQEALFRLMQGRTTIVIAHRLSTVTAADEILVIGNGRVIERGTHEELLENGGYYRHICEEQFKGIAPLADRMTAGS